MKYTPSVVNLIIGGIEVKSFPSGTGITLEFCQLYPFGYGINIFFRLSSNGTLIILDIDKFLRLSSSLDNLITNQILVEKIKIQGKGTGIIGWQTIEIKLSKIKTILGVSAVPIRSQSQIDFLSYSITSIKYRVYSSSGEPLLSTNSYVFEILVFGY